MTTKYGLLSFFALALLPSCFLQLTVPAQSVSNSEIDNLAAKGFIGVSPSSIASMEKMYVPYNFCPKKRNTCGLYAGIRVGFVLDPQEVFYNTSTTLPNDARYKKLAEDYPIMRVRDIKEGGEVGLLPGSMARFWSQEFKSHKASAMSFESQERMFEKMKEELKEGRPVILNVQVSGAGIPVFVPENHFGLRTFPMTHWIVILAYSEKDGGSWLIRDNGGLGGTLTPEHVTELLTMSDKSLRTLANVGALADELKLYLDEPLLPIVLADPKEDSQQTLLKEDFRSITAFNIIVFSRKT